MFVRAGGGIKAVGHGLRSAVGSGTVVCGRGQLKCTPSLRVLSSSSSGLGSPTSASSSPQKFSLNTPLVPKPFDTYEFVKALEDSGLTRDQAVAIMQHVKAAVAEATAQHTEFLVTKQDLVNLHSDLGEKTFNATMKFDIAQRHMREIHQKDMQNLRADLLAADQANIGVLQTELANMERASLRRREMDEQRYAALQAETASVERRILQYGLGTLVTLATLALGVARIFK
eukprot:TRINITY_DN1548_c0_g1_i2.p1 TRINITY_DN1548_c0_g1~~TRINITY_DN1548_c0_g1_i2.p1  ORF type:complete len:247 (+),score=66.05 TRINITY_DN1548_c0_g1_i2:53-742(+)